MFINKDVISEDRKLAKSQELAGATLAAWPYLGASLSILSVSVMLLAPHSGENALDKNATNGPSTGALVLPALPDAKTISHK